MHSFDPELVELVLGYVRASLAIPEASLEFPGDRAVLEAAVAASLTPGGTDPRKVLEVYADTLSQTVLSADSPRFLAFIPAAPTKAALLFDAVVSASSLQGIAWLEAAGAIVAENQVLRWIADLAGMPASAGGTFVSGGSAANLSALTVARELGRRRTGQRHVRIAMSKQAHSSIGSSLSILDVEPLLIDAEDHRITAASFQRALDAYDGKEPIVGVALTSGTTNAGLIDDIAGVGEIARRHDMWVHVDGAYGGAGLMSSLVRDQYAGIELVDSFITDPHKWWFAPYDCAAIIYRDPALAVSVHTQDASYLDVLHENLASNQYNPTDLAYHLTRRARGLPLWFSLAVHGTDAYVEAVDASILLARETAELIKTLPYLELIREPTLSVVLWRRIGWEQSDYDALQHSLSAKQTAFVTPTKWEGETVGRFAFLHPHTSIDLVKEIFELCK